MSSIGRVVLNAGAASAVGEVIECSGITHLHLFAKVAVTVGDLASSRIEFASTPDGQGNLLLPAVAPNIATPNIAVAETAPAPTGVALDAAEAKITLATLAIGTSLFQIRLTNPPPYVVPRFIYGTGGGAVSVQVFAYGFSVKT